MSNEQNEFNKDYFSFSNVTLNTIASDIKLKLLGNGNIVLMKPKSSLELCMSFDGETYKILFYDKNRSIQDLIPDFYKAYPAIKKSPDFKNCINAPLDNDCCKRVLEILKFKKNIIEALMHYLHRDYELSRIDRFPIKGIEWEYIEECINRLLQTKYIKSWFGIKDIKTFNNKKDYKLTMIDCIKNCTSPYEKIIDKEIELIFKAFSLFEPKKTKIIILGKDPYPDKEKAHGLAFSCKDGYEKIDDSLLNIFKAIQAYKKNTTFKKLTKEQINELNDRTHWNTNLESWAKKNGVLLLNTALTYEKYEFYNKDNLSEKDQKFAENEQNKLYTKHKNAWEPFIELVLTKALQNNENVVVFLWGTKAQKYEKLIKEINNNAKIFKTSHPDNRGVNKGPRSFSENTPIDFKDCDKVLKNNCILTSILRKSDRKF